METLKKIKELIEKMSVDTQKVFEKGNRSASIRARKNAQEVKSLIGIYLHCASCCDCLSYGNKKTQSLIMH